MAMGSHFYEGKLLPRDHALARRWFEEAAAGEDPEGMYNLSAMLARGEGGPRDVARAWALMKGAAARGHLIAPKAIPALEGRMTASEKQAAAAMLSGGSAR
jgi:TPR repeat protein